MAFQPQQAAAAAAPSNNYYNNYQYNNNVRPNPSLSQSSQYNNQQQQQRPFQQLPAQYQQQVSSSQQAQRQQPQPQLPTTPLRYPTQNQQQQQQPQSPSSPPSSTKSRPKTGQRRSSLNIFKRSSSSHSGPIHETSADKRKMSATTKANPNAAMTEAQPMALALEKSTMVGLANIQCTDIYGNPISDPDRSNPTRWRMERPLDTIKSFEAAIDKAHAQRSNAFVPGAPSTANGWQSQRNSSYMGPDKRQSSYQTSREELTANEYGTPPLRQQHGSRGGPPASSSAAWNNGSMAPSQPGYGNPGLARSKDTLNTAGGNSYNSSASEWNNSTVPTSEDSSIDRVNGITRPINGARNSHGYGNYPGTADHYDYTAGYEDEQYSSSPSKSSRAPPPPQHQQSYGYSQQYPQQGYNNGFVNGYQQQPAQNQNQNQPPRPPVKDGNKLTRQNTNNNKTSHLPTAGAVRDSWFKRRFSKQK